MVASDIAKAVSKAVPNPEFYGPDKYKINNDGTYRAFEKHRYRISYKITKMTIVVLRVRHTKLEPKPFRFFLLPLAVAAARSSTSSNMAV